MALWQKTFYIDLTGKHFRIKGISSDLDKALKRDWGTASIQCWGNPDTNDILVSWNKDTQVIDEDIRIRLDLRSLDLNFIQWVIHFAHKRDLKFKLIKTEIFEPELSEICRILADSNAEKFVNNPRKFLDDLQKGIILPE